ncbi:MAG TPA: hypothetical protein VLT45_26430 [Kofleriaceae bacterium]|nr:hypothetical protein [Kofleriaceae bacterium]
MRYRDELALACGSPLYPVDARTVPSGELAATVAEMSQRFAANVPVVVGTHAEGGRVTVVIAARGIAFEPFHPGDREIRGRLLLKVHALQAYVSSADGVHVSDIALAGGAFHIPAPAEDADVVIAIFDGRDTGPLGRVRVGAGSPLFTSPGALLARTNAARRHLGVPTLAHVPLVGDCSAIPAQVGGTDVSDKASCYLVPSLDEALLASAAMYSPLMQAKLIAPDAALLQIGRIGEEAALRVLRRFETLTPAEGRARVLAALRARWPNASERPASLQPVLDHWAASREPDKTHGDFKDEIAHVAAGWTPTGHFAYALATARDLDTAIAEIPTDGEAAFVDVAYTQVRDARGEMRHLIAAVVATR